MNRVWTYIISKALDPETLAAIEADGASFVKGWTAHEQKLSGDFSIYGGRIIVVKVNEENTAASGCSIDKLTRFIKETEKKYGIGLLNRMLVACRKGHEVEVIPVQQVRTLLAEGSLSAETPVYNTAVSNEAELQQWEQPLKMTWLAKFLEPA